MKRHFVTFFSPGTLVSEQTTRDIESWDVPKAQEMAQGITERYDAVPYGFQFSTRTRNAEDLDSRVSKRSSMYYINCKVETLAEIEKRNDPKEKILLENMRCNGWDSVVVSTKGWKWTQPLQGNDVVLEI